MDPFVCYRIVINEGQSRRMNIKVKEGDDIDSIIRGIKLKNSVLLASVSLSSIELFESIESAEPLHALTKWNTDVTWGKPETPLIVQVQPLAVAPGNNSEGKCFWCLLSNLTYLSPSNSSSYHFNG